MKNATNFGTHSEDRFPLSRRGFIKGAACVGTAAVMAGCSKDSDTEYVYIPGTGTGTGGETEVEVSKFYGVTGHNCGGRCVSMAHVSNGRIIRIMNDDSIYAYDGSYMDPNSRNIANTRSCSRCRSYRYRVHHAGRLLYPLKQTKKRGDLTGFVRISWDQALTEIAGKHMKVNTKYGVDAIYQIYAAGASAGSFNTAGGALNTFGLPLIDGAKTSTWGSYSTHQWWFAQNGLTGAEAIRANHSNNIAQYANNLVMWGDNGMATSNPSSYSTMKSIEDMKARVKTKSGYNADFDGRVVYVGPSFSDTGVVSADEWLPSQPYTDVALVAGMIYHMLDNTFYLDGGAGTSASNKGTLRPAADRWLDVDYLDTLVYGFFDSPAYHLDEVDGYITAAKTLPVPANSRNVPEVLVGQSYCSWILGNDSSAMTYAASATNYTAAQFAAIAPAAKRWAPCSYTVNGVAATAASVSASKYRTKQDYLKAKTPAWASAITGVPEARIKYLAELFCKHGPVFVRWSGGFQKQAEGVQNFYATQALNVVVGNVGHEGSVFAWGPFSGATTTGTSSPVPAAFSTVTASKLPAKAVASCTAWHAVLKNTYYTELTQGGYDVKKYIPNYGSLGKDNAYWDDGGVKSFVKWDRNTDGTLTADPVTGFFPYKKDGSGNPIYSGIRMIYNGGGNIFMNQHENTNDSRSMLEALPLSKDDADSFCMVSIDNFLSPTPRWSDYVLPGATYWEQPELFTPDNSTQFYMSPAVTPPGESRLNFDIGRQIVRKYTELGGKTLLDNDPLSTVTASAADYINGKSIEDIVKAAYNPANAGGKTWAEYKAEPIVRKRADDYTTVTPCRKVIMNGANGYYSRTAAQLLNEPFIKVAEAGNNSTSPFLSTNNTRHVITYEVNTFTQAPGAGAPYGVQYLPANVASAPKASLRMQVYNPVMLWNYAHRFEQWHGYLADQSKSVGQNKKDLENDPLVLGIPVYYAWQDYFLEAYGDGTLAGSDVDIANKYPFKLTTTHNRFRAHSSMAENPLLRELSHSTPGKKTYNGAREGVLKGNDYTYYATPPSQAFSTGNGGAYPYLNSLINNNVTKADLVDSKNKGMATFNHVYINPDDAAALSPAVATGDLVELRNPIGIVYAVAKLTKRCAKGYVDLHQGAWYDPRTIDGEIVDVGGCCNTLMASQPSRIDHGNAEQSALVKITKINY